MMIQLLRMIKKIKLKTSCNSKALILESNIIVKKNYLEVFLSKGFTSPGSYVNSGLFYVQQGNFVATCSFGTNRINIRCSGNDCEEKIQNFENILTSLS